MRQRPSRPGYTLVEVLVAVVVFALGIMSLFGSYTLALRLTQGAREISIATELAQDNLEQLRNVGFDSLAVNSSPAPVATTKLTGGQTKTFVQVYAGNNKIKQVTIEVYWVKRPESQAITLTTLIGQGGVSG